MASDSFGFVGAAVFTRRIARFDVGLLAIGLAGDTDATMQQENFTDEIAFGMDLRMDLLGSNTRSRRRRILIIAGLVCAPVAMADDSSWQPRPLALPAVPGHDRPSQNRASEAPPLITPAAVAPIIIQLPAAEPAPTPPPVVLGPQITRPRTDWQPPDPTSPTSPQQAVPAPDPVAAAARSTQLAQTAIDQLRQAHWSAHRGAAQSARHSAWETLRTIASMRDDQNGGVQHTLQLKAAQVAIDEAADFTGRFGRVDASGLRRMIDAHETTVLKAVDTSSLTPARAVESYLNHAREHLVDAVGGGPLASSATMILADLEQVAPTAGLDEETAPRQLDLLASELSLMLRSAALQIDPTNPAAAAGLGRTLLARSLPQQAVPYLKSAATVSPTRQNVEDLMRASGQVGDFATVAQCENQLTTVQLPSELPVQWLTPTQFAATHQQMSGPPRSASPPRAVIAPTQSQPQVAIRPNSPSPIPNRESQIVDPSISPSNRRFR